MLWRLAYLTVTTTFVALRLLPSSDWDKDVEILALRHQIAVLERHLGGKKLRFTLPDRALLAALLRLGVASGPGEPWVGISARAR